MFLKLMGAESAPDHDTRKRFTLLAKVTAVDFERVLQPTPNPDGSPDVDAYARVTFESGEVEQFYMMGNAYVLSDAGKTIASFSKEPIPEIVSFGLPAAFPAAA